MKLSNIKHSRLVWFCALYVISLVVVGGFMLVVHLVPQLLIWLSR